MNVTTVKTKMLRDRNHRQRPKRTRTSLACYSCRRRKVSCRGSRPCVRCQQLGLECNDVPLSERTPLTRKRMTELEETITEYHRLWDYLHPQLPLDSIRDKVTADGLEKTLKEIQNAATGSVYPPTRPASPQTLSLQIAFDIQSASQTASSEWNEDGFPQDNPPHISTIEKNMGDVASGKDFGTGLWGGVGYLGLSSGATLLRTIQRFTPGKNSSSDRLHNSGHHVSSGKSTSAVPGERCQFPPLPPAREIGSLVNSYFQYFHALTPIVHEPTIRAQLTGALPQPTVSGSRVLFNMIFAMGALDSATDDAPGNTGLQYYEIARAALQHDLVEGGSLLLVQGLAIMAIYLQRINKPNAGYVCLGLAIRMAMALGVHVSAVGSNDKGLTVLESEMRCRIWWGLVTLEAGQCLTYGRPHGISLSSLSAVPLPVNTEDECLTVSSTRRPRDTESVTRYTALITQARLAQAALHSLDRISASLPSPTVEQVKWCGNYFRSQIATLPAYTQALPPHQYRLAHAIQTWRARDYMSILYRPVFLSAAWSSGGKATSDEAVREIVEACRALALDNLRDIAEFVQINHDTHRGCEWYVLYYGIQASLTVLLSIVWEPHHPCSVAWREHIKQTTMWLRQLKSMKPLGMSWAQIMENILSAQPVAEPDSTEEYGIPLQLEELEETVPSEETFDFERYFSEIWGDQTQIHGMTMTNDMEPGPESDILEDMIRSLSGCF